jgi:lipid II:glycine glycyltransferase (peptidoglycan interpeptide bridge formation enzyme)
MMDLRQSKNYAEYMKLLGWEIVKIKSCYCYLKKIPIFGYFAKIQRPENKLNACDLVKLSEGRRLIALYLEPKDEIQEDHYKKELHFIKMKSSSLPSRTVRIELKRTSKDLLSDMHYKTRYNIKLAERTGVKVGKAKDIKRFAEFWKKCALKRGMFLPMKREIDAIYKAFGRDAEIYEAYIRGKMVAAVLTVATKNCVYYMYAASSEEGKKCFAPTALVWEIIKDAKKQGKKWFDFEGIYDERFPIKSWKGFTRFKKSFGGIEIEYPGTMRRLLFWNLIKK